MMINVKNFILITALILLNCDRNDYHGVDHMPICIKEKDKRELAEFIKECAEKANPLSDEEGEDLVRQCEMTGKNTICPLVMCLNPVVYGAPFLPCSMAKNKEGIQKCKEAGYVYEQ